MEIRMYIEGDKRLGTGFNEFLGPVKTKARIKGIKWDMIFCGSGSNAFSDFELALETYPNAFNMLLVDAEGSVQDINNPWGHLSQSKPQGVDNKQCHLMVQMMETWFLSDKEALKTYYGQGFLENQLPNTAQVETIPKRDVESKLKAATRNTQKGEYHKTHHAPKILEKLDVTKVRDASPACERLFQTLEAKVDEVP